MLRLSRCSARVAQAAKSVKRTNFSKVSTRHFFGCSSVQPLTCTHSAGNINQRGGNNAGNFLQRRTFADITLITPGMGDSITEGTIAAWSKDVGEYVNVDDVVLVIETDKVSIDVRATDAGVIKEIKAEVDDTVEIGAELCVIDTDAPKPEGVSAPPPTTTEEAQTPAPSKPAPAPSESKPAQTPSPQTKSAPPAPPKSPSAPPTQISPSAGPPTTTNNRGERRVTISRMRARIAERLKDAQNTAACLTSFNEIDCSAMMELRAKHKDDFLEKHGVKLGFMSIFVKAATAALLDSPVVNARMEEKEIVYNDYVDISVAVASPTGLVVPVLRNCEQMSFADVERGINEYGQKARDGTIAIEDMAGGTFTISNGGVFKSLMGTPIINPPQTAILGMHGIFERPVAVNGQVEIRPMMYIALTYDHRMIDGREAVTFLRKIKQCVEDPHVMLLDI